MTKAQNYIDKHYSHQQRAAAKKLDLRNKSLEGNLDLTSFYNLEELDCSNNFINLEVLIVGNDSDKKNNNFAGSLKPLQNLSCLQELDISNTDIDSGLDFLPANLVSIRCYNDKNNNLGVSIINEALKPYNFQINKWRQDHASNYVDFQVQLEEKEERIRELENQVKSYRETLTEFSEQLGQKETRQAETQTMEEENQQIAQVEVLTPHTSS